MKPRAETLVIRRREFERFAALRRQGMSWSKIARHVGVSVHHVRYVLKAIPVPSRVSLASVGERPDWSYPDADLLELAHECRAEIEEALRHARHVP